MHIKHQKNRGSWSLPGFFMVEAGSEQCLSFLGCYELCVERLCWLRARGHHSRATFTSRRPKARGKRRFWTVVLYLSSTPRASSPILKASASVWACHFSWLSILFPSGVRVCPQPLMKTAEGKRMENQEVLGLSNMTEVVCFNGGKGWALVVARGWGVVVWREDGRWCWALLSLWVGGRVLALLGACLSLQILVILGLDVLVIVRGGGTLQIGPVGPQNHQVVDQCDDGGSGAG